MPGVRTIMFDQCMVGLTSPSGTHMRKRTKLLTNSLHIAQAFSGRLCDRSHAHTVIKGTELGYKLSRFAQIYPERMCELIAEGAAMHLQ